MSSQPEVWLRGALEGYPPLLMPVAHSLLQVREELHRLASEVSEAHVWLRRDGSASVGFHVRHTGGALDRLLTYARGEQLSASQLDALRAEEHPGQPFVEIVREVDDVIERALAQVRITRDDELLQPRRVGRAGLPSTVIGLLVHAAEHSNRHLGQAISTARLLSSMA